VCVCVCVYIYIYTHTYIYMRVCVCVTIVGNRVSLNYQRLDRNQIQPTRIR